MREVGFISSSELQYCTDRRIENTGVNSENLLLIRRKEEVDTIRYTSASSTATQFLWITSEYIRNRTILHFVESDELLVNSELHSV